MRLFAVLMLCAVGAFASPLSIKGMAIGEGHELCGSEPIEDFDAVGAELRAQVGAKDWRPTTVTTCRVELQTYGGKQVKDGKATLHFLGAKLALVSFDMEAMTSTELVEFMRAMGAAYGGWTSSKDSGRHKYRWIAGSTRLTVGRDVSEVDSLFRPDVRLESPTNAGAMLRAMQRTAAFHKRISEGIKADIARLQAQDAR